MKESIEIVGMWVRIIGCRAYVHDPANINCLCGIIGCQVKVTGYHREYLLRYEGTAYRIRRHRKIVHKDELVVLAEQPPSLRQFDKLVRRAFEKMAQRSLSVA